MSSGVPSPGLPLTSAQTCQVFLQPGPRGRDARKESLWPACFLPFQKTLRLPRSCLRPCVHTAPHSPMNLLLRNQSLGKQDCATSPGPSPCFYTVCCTAGGQGRAPRYMGLGEQRFLSHSSLLIYALLGSILPLAHITTPPRADLDLKNRFPQAQVAGAQRERWVRVRVKDREAALPGRRKSIFYVRCQNPPSSAGEKYCPHSLPARALKQSPPNTQQPYRERAIPLVLRPGWLGSLEWGEV